MLLVHRASCPRSHSCHWSRSCSSPFLLLSLATATCTLHSSGCRKKRLRLNGPCCGQEERWPVRAMRFGQAEGTGSKEVAAGRMRDRGGTGREPKLAAYVCHVAVDGALAYHRRGLRRHPRPPLRRFGRRGHL